MFPFITRIFVAVALVLLGQCRVAGYALLAGLAVLLLHVLHQLDSGVHVRRC
jgi:hypothetical protein